MLEFTHGLTPVLPTLLSRVQDLFDLNARPDIIGRQLSQDKVLAPLVNANPGMRVPGAFKGFEMGVRAILGQQITVKAATTIAGRLVAVLGEPYVTPYPELNRLTPAAAHIAAATVDDLARHGIVGARCRSILALAQAEVLGELSLDGGTHPDPDAMIGRLAELPGIGQWTAHYIAMRALRWPDAFPKGDIAVLNNLGGVTAKQAGEMSQAWRPWRSYAVLHIWNMPRLVPVARPCGMRTRTRKQKMPDAADIVSHLEPESSENPWVHGAPPEEAIEVVAYNPDWLATFEKLAGAIATALGAVALRIDHIGSTAVPGLAAKPVIDMDLTIQDPSDEKTYVPALEGIGYDLVIREPAWHRHRCLRLDIPRVNLHVFGPDCPENIRHLLFRDWLRGHLEDRELYGQAKRLALGGARHVMDYNLRKQSVIRDIYARAFKAAGLL
jgi:3-methyladenine DNA glycosylase/8-oxoguanine DNA glycosylase/GrpB-like predicted nucleotidyltransferase (UPF0157 family)